VKHLVILALISVGVYAAWRVASPQNRDLVLGFTKKHAGPIFFIAAALFALVAMAVALPSASIF
jgi:hypothetical protein